MIRVAVEPWREMVAHARSTYPNECCGAMLGKIDGDQKEVLAAMRLENSFSSVAGGAVLQGLRSPVLYQLFAQVPLRGSQVGDIVGGFPI